MKKKLPILLILVLTIIALIPISTVVIGQVQSKDAPAPSTPVPTIQLPKTVPLDANTLFDLVNQERIKAGVAPMVRDARLDASAQQKADDMFNNNYFNHSNPITGKHGYEYIPAELCKRGGENILNANTPYTGDNNAYAVEVWMGSKLHHDAILNSKNKISGLAISGDKIVQHFCQPY